MLKSEAAAYLAGVTQTEGAEASAPTNLHVITGEVGEASADGKTLVKIDGLMFSESDDQFIEVDALGGLEEGDIATIVLTGEQGHAMTPLALGSIGSVDRITVRIAAIEADYIKVEQLDAAEARIGELEADHVSVDDLDAATARIGTLETTRATITDLEAATARIGDLEADHVSTDDLNAATARIGTLEADHVSTDDLNAAKARIGTLETNTADIGTIRANSAKVQNLTAAELEADHATVGSLSTTYATIANLNAANGRITNLESTKANISDLEADYITADEIEATYMHANMSNSDVAWIQNGTIKDGAIVSAMINDVSANKLTAGTINGSVINVTNLNADNITTGTINGQRIGEGSLSLSKLEDDVYTESEVDAKLATMQAEIDGAIETWTGTSVPTLNNSPASNWTTAAVRDTHVGDVYFVVNSQSQQNGYNYRFTKSGSTYSWQLIKDSDVTNALQRLETAEGKITTFDSDISTLKTDTGSLTTRTTNLETRMSDAEDDILDKVDTTTFNEVSDTVDQHSQTISQHTTAISNKADSSTVTAVTNRVSKNEQDISGINTTIGELQDTLETKADGSTVSTISNKLNTVSDTVDGHTQTLTSVQNTLSTKADSSTVSTLTTKVNTISDTVDGHTQSLQSITQTYATKTELGEVVDNRVVVDEEFLYRTTGGEQDVPSGRATVQSIKGNTLVWNQLAQLPFGYNRTLQGITFTRSGDGMTFSGTSTAIVYNQIYTQGNNSLYTKVGHVYYVCKRGTGIEDVQIYNDNGGIRLKDASSAIGTANAEKRWYFRLDSGLTVDGYAVVNIIDLTAMFGAGNEPATVEEFETLFPEPYYPYDAGSLLPVRMTGIETVGFNQWDEEWELGAIDESTGEKRSATNSIRSKNYTPVIPNTDYYFKCPSASGLYARLFWYDADYNFISYNNAVYNAVKTAPPNARYMLFLITNVYGTAYNNDICINISDPARNGEYEPYWSSQRAIPVATYFPDGMWGFGSYRDALYADRAEHNVGKAVLAIGDGVTFSAAEEPNKTGLYSHTLQYTTAAWNESGLDRVPTISSGTYLDRGQAYSTLGISESANLATSTSAGIQALKNNRRVYLRWPTLLTEEEFTQLVSGVNSVLLFHLATPTTTTIDPPLNLTYRAESGGTERVMVDATLAAPQSAPVPMSIQYGINIYETAAEDALRTASIESRVTTAESTIEQHGASITLKANSADVYTKQQSDGLMSTEVTNRNAAITAKANEITSSVSETYTTKEEFNNLEIGGRNLALNTAGVIIDRTESPDGSRYEYSYFDLGRALPFGAGTPIVISFDLYMPIKSGSPRFLVYNTNRKGPHQTLFDVNVLSGKNLPVGSIVDERIVIKTSVYADRSDSTLPNDYLEFYSNYGSNNFYRISNLKLEKGNKATEWTPAPEDIETRVSSAESSISQNAENIELKVSKDGVISSINQSAETVKIQASRVEIDGTAVFSAISSDVDDAITSKGYQTSSQVNSAITSKGYATTTQAQGYASTAKSEAISSAATDATTKANAAEANAKAYTDSVEIGGRNLFVSSLTSIGYPTDKAIGTQYGITGMSGNHEAYQLVPVEEGASYVLQYWVDDSEHQGWICIQLLDSEGIVVSKLNRTYPNADYWTRTFTIPSGVTTALVSGRHLAAGYEYAKLKFEKGTKPTDWSPAPEDIEADAVKRTQRIWYRTNGSSAPSTPGTASSNWVTKADDGNDAWTKMHIAISSTHKYIYTCEQYEMANGTVGYTSVLLDNTITVIDGGNIITGSVTANQIAANAVTADKLAANSLTIGKFTEADKAKVDNSYVQVGGRNLLAWSDRKGAMGTSSSGLSWTYDADGWITVTGTINSSSAGLLLFWGTSTATNYVYPAGTYTVTVENDGLLAANVLRAQIGYDGTYTYLYDSGSLTLDTENGISRVCLYRYGASGTSVNGRIRFKMEKGNKATDWTPAPEDQTAYVDAIQVGGRNLLLRTATLSDTTYWWRNSITSVIENETDERGGSDAVLVTPSTTSWYLASTNDNTRINDIGRQYVASVWMRADTETNVQLCCRYLKNDTDPYSNNATRKIVTVTTEWQQFAVAGKMINNQTSENNCVWVGQLTSVPVYVSHFKFERGNKPTDWTPAPEDQIDAVDQTYIQNLTPYFLTDMTKTSDEYWANLTYERFTRLGDGWAHFEYTNSGSSTVNNYIKPKVLDFLEPGGKYTLLIEFKNVSISKDGGSFYSQQGGDVQVWGDKSYCGFAITNAEIRALSGGAGTFYKTLTLLTADSKDPSGTVRGSLPKTSFMSINQQVQASQTISYDLRLSLYADGYTGPYKPYSGDQLYATNSALTGTNESLEGAIADIGELSDQLVDTTTEQNKTIATIQTYLNSLRKDLDAEIQSRQQWLNFNAAEGLVIGAAGSTFKTVTTNTSQQFRSGGTVLAETSGSEFVAPVMRSDQILIGNWMWTRRDNGNLSLKWIG